MVTPQRAVDCQRIVIVTIGEGEKNSRLEAKTSGRLLFEKSSLIQEATARSGTTETVVALVP